MINRILLKIGIVFSFWWFPFETEVLSSRSLFWSIFIYLGYPLPEWLRNMVPYIFLILKLMSLCYESVGAPVVGLMTGIGYPRHGHPNLPQKTSWAPTLPSLREKGFGIGNTFWSSNISVWDWRYEGNTNSLNSKFQWNVMRKFLVFHS